MSWHITRLEDVVPSPWKNGGGTTRELAAWPDTDKWVWRISVAEVAASGPFSRFEGVDRWFSVLSGTGVVLKTAEQTCVVTRSSQPFCFDGALATECELINGTTLDFNLMTRRNRIEAMMTRIESTWRVVVENFNTIAIFPMNTRASVQFNSKVSEIQPNTLVWQPVVTGDRIRLDTRSALVITMKHEVGV
jgi:uncharacterized protein